MNVSARIQADSLRRLLHILIASESANRGFTSGDTLDVLITYVPDSNIFRVAIKHAESFQTTGAEAGFNLVRDQLPSLGRRAGEDLLRKLTAEAVSFLAEHRGKPGTYRN